MQPFLWARHASVMALRKSNVETFIVFRASTPLCRGSRLRLSEGALPAASLGVVDSYCCSRVGLRRDGRPVLRRGLRGLQLVLFVLWAHLF